MRRQLKNPKFYVMLLGDGILFTTAYIAACLIRFDFQVDSSQTHYIHTVFPHLPFLKLIVFYGFGQCISPQIGTVHLFLGEAVQRFSN